MVNLRCRCGASCASQPSPAMCARSIRPREPELLTYLQCIMSIIIKPGHGATSSFRAPNLDGPCLGRSTSATSWQLLWHRAPSIQPHQDEQGVSAIPSRDQAAGCPSARAIVSEGLQRQVSWLQKAVEFLQGVRMNAALWDFKVQGVMSGTIGIHTVHWQSVSLAECNQWTATLTCLKAHHCC